MRGTLAPVPSGARWAVVLTLAVCAALAIAAAALGAYSRGIYRTKPPAHRGQWLDLSFTAGRSAATTFTYSYRKLKACSNGTNSIGDDSGYAPIRAGAISTRTGTFVVSATTGRDRVQIAGRIKGRKASGTFRDFFVTSTGITCDTGTLHWKALRLG